MTKKAKKGGGKAMKTKSHWLIQCIVWRALQEHWDTKKKFDTLYLGKIIDNIPGLKKREKHHAKVSFELVLRTSPGCKKTGKQIEDAYAEFVAGKKRQHARWDALIKEKKDIVKLVKKIDKKDPGFFIQ